MKPVYWRPNKMAASTIGMIGFGAILALVVVEFSPRWAGNQHRQEQLEANQLAQRCRYKIREVRKANGLKLNRMFDPAETGLVGVAMSSITSKPAALEAKQLSLHAQFPGAIVQMLHEAGVRRGDTVAVGWTGSFPGLNVALTSAMETLELNPLIVASVTSSQYGANEPDLTWLDMESSLHQAGLVRCKSMAATVGGPADCGKGMSDDTYRVIDEAAKRNEVRLLKANGLAKSIDARIRLLKKKAGKSKIAAYVNVGGGTASCGGGDCVFSPGVNSTRLKESDSPVDCVMQRYHDAGLPVIHLANPRSLGRRYGLSTESEMAVANVGPISYAAPSRILASVALALICITLRAFVLSDTGDWLMNRVIKRLRGDAPLRAVGQVEGPQLMV